MAIERTNEGLEVRLKSSGIGRYVGGAFLTFWLCGWAVGEGIVLWLLVKGGIALLTGTPPDPGREPLQAGPAVMVGVFLLAWLTMWTFGGIAAIAELLRLLWGDDRIVVASGRIRVTSNRGPFRTTREFERDAIQRIVLVGRGANITLESNGKRHELSNLGSPAERSEGANALRAALSMPELAGDGARPTIPPAWEEVITPEGERALVPNLDTRRKQARFTSIVTMLLAAATFVVARDSLQRPEVMIPAFIMLVFTAGLAAGTVWLARGRMEWRIGSGRLTLRKRYGGRVRDVFEGRRLLLDTSTDSDGDVWYELDALAEGVALTPPSAIEWHAARRKGRRTVVRVMNDAPAVHNLAAWLAQETGMELEDRTKPEAREVQLAELREALEKSGRFGQWAAKLVDRVGQDRKQAS